MTFGAPANPHRIRSEVSNVQISVPAALITRIPKQHMHLSLVRHNLEQHQTRRCCLSTLRNSVHVSVTVNQ